MMTKRKHKLWQPLMIVGNTIVLLFILSFFKLPTGTLNSLEKIESNENFKPSQAVEENFKLIKIDTTENKTSNTREINFNMQKLGNIQANGFFGNPNKTDYPNISNEKRKPISYNNDIYAKDTPPLYYNLPSIQEPNYQTNFNQELTNHQYFINENHKFSNNNFNNNQNSNVNLIFAIKCLLDELNGNELERARIAVEKKLIQLRKSKYNMI
jgi:hypothetical protein